MNIKRIGLIGGGFTGNTVTLGSNIHIGTGDPNLNVSDGSIFIGTSVYIEHGFDTRNIFNGEGGSVEIVNDLTTGGANRALSAEMGKELAKEATTEHNGLMSAEDKKYTLYSIDKTVTLVSSEIYESLNLGYIIPKGSYVHIEGDFNKITCRTNPSDTKYQTISGDGIADRDITYIKMGGVGTATMTIKGIIIQKIESNSDAITKNTDDIKDLQTLKIGECYILESNLVPYPARRNGSTTSSGTYKGYEVSIEDAFVKGFKFIKVRAASYVKATSDTSVVPCLVYDKNGNVESVITEFETFSTAWYILPITENSKTLRASYAEAPFVSGTNVHDKIVFEPYKYELLTDNDANERLSIIEETLENVGSLINGVEIFLPPEIHILKGRMTQLFFRGFIKAVDPYIYDIKVQCSVGKTYKRYYEIEHNTAGDFPFKIEVRDNNKNVLGVAETTIKIIEPSSASSKNILCCGASATETGHWAAELKRLLTTGSEKYSGLNLPMTFVGRKVGSADKSVQLEATGGWTWSTFISAGVPAVRFYVSGMTGNIGIGTKLTLNDAEKGTLHYSVLEVNLTEGVGNIRCGEVWPNPVVLPSSTSGTLIGDSISITYNNAVEERFVPFYNAETGEVDFRTYADNYCNGDIDIIITHMGVNSVLGENSSTPTASIKAFLDGYFRDFPNGKILVSAIPFPDYGTNVYANTYKENNTNRYGSLCSFFDYNKNLYEISQLDEYKGKVIYCPSNVFFDTDYGYPKTNKDVNSRIVSIKESIDTNGVHPIKEGSYLVSDSILPTIVTL